MLESLRQLNPSLPFHSVHDAAFRSYGRVIDFDSKALVAACETAAVMPEAGSRYVPACSTGFWVAITIKGAFKG